jgi:hypothetical protein
MATTMNHKDFVARLVSGKEVFLKRNLCCVTFSVVLLSLVPDLFVPLFLARRYLDEGRFR